MTDEATIPASIVIPAFNEVFLTRLCLLSLERADLRGAEVIVVDNGSSDATPQLLGEWEHAGPRRIAVRSEENLGFARGCNLGASRATGDVIVFLNNDTFVMPDWLPALLAPFAEPSVWVTGSRLLYPNGRIQHAGVTFGEDGPGHVFAGLPGDSPLVLQQREYQAVTGAALAIRRRVFEQLGGFDTAYVNSYEDGDLCLRVREAGGRILYVPTSIAYHWESMSRGRLTANDERNKQLFLGRWRGKFEADYDRTMREAEKAGYDLGDRLPTRREQHDRQLDLEQAAAERDQLRRRLAEVRPGRDLRSIPLARAAWHRLPHRTRRWIRRVSNPGPTATLQPPALPDVRFRMSTSQGRDQTVTAIAGGGWASFQEPLPDVFAAAVRRQSGGLVLDVGANSGFYSLLAAAAGAHSEVHAFAPHPAARKALERNLRLNPWLRSRVQVMAVAVTDRTGLGEIHLRDPRRGRLRANLSLRRAFKDDSVGRSAVPLVTLDDHLANQPEVPVRVIKVDAESAPHLVLAGARRVIASHRPAIFVEILPGGDTAALEAIRSELGYVPVRLEPKSARLVDRIAFNSSGWNQMLVPEEQLTQWLDVIREVVPVLGEAPGDTGRP